MSTLKKPYSASTKYMTFRADYERNRITLWGDAFLVDEVGGRIDFAVSPTLFGAIASQWNSEDLEMIVNFRLNWIPRPGSDLFIVFNQLAETEDTRWSPYQATLLSKIVWRIAF